MAKSTKTKPAKAAQPKKASRAKAAGSKKSVNRETPIIFPEFALMAAVSGTSVSANVNVTFVSGVGQLTASLFRNGILINMQSVSNSGTIFLSDVQSGDVLSINGVCAGTASIAISVSTSPATPQNFGAGPFHVGYIIL